MYFLLVVPYPVKVSTLTGQVSEFLIRGDELVVDLKEKIYLVHGIPVHEQRLVFKQQVLQDASSFGESEVLSGCTVHLVLVTAELQDSAVMGTTTTTFRCPSMTPTLSIHHFKVGFSTEQLSHFTSLQTTPLQPHPHRISLPSHLAHIVHVYDVPYRALWMFLRYLHCRTLQDEGWSWHCAVRWWQLQDWLTTSLAVIVDGM